MNRSSRWALAALLAATALAHGSEPPEPEPAPLARSALITLEGTVIPGGLILRVRPNEPTHPLSVSELSVAIDGKEVPHSARADGTWQVPLPPRAAAGTAQLEVTVAHDGVRELLSAAIPVSGAPAAQSPSAPPTAPATGRGSLVHNQLVWWALNVTIVLVATLALSRRKS